MKLEFLLFLTFVSLSSVFGGIEPGNVEKNMLTFEGEGDVNSIFDNLKKAAEGKSKKYKKWDIDDSESSGDVDEISGDEGSGPDEFSGDFTTTQAPTKEKTDKTSTAAVVDITLVSTTKETTTISNCVDCDVDPDKKKGKGIDVNINVVSGEENDDYEEEEDEEDEDDVSATPGKKPNNQRVHGKQKKKKVVNFTVGIIVGVVVGAVLAILIIIFLVYRLRKKDEGSYSLDEQSSTAYLRGGDTDSPKGKEYFA